MVGRNLQTTSNAYVQQVFNFIFSDFLHYLDRDESNWSFRTAWIIANIPHVLLINFKHAIKELQYIFFYHLLKTDR
jgi:hypothetical protein